MESETLPPIPTIDAGEYSDILAEVRAQEARGIYDETVEKRTKARTAELMTQAFRPEGIDAIEREQAELAEKQAVLEAKRNAKVQAVETYKSLFEDVQKAEERLRRADDQMSYEATAENAADAQREFIVSQLGVRGTHFDTPGAFNRLFAQIGISEIIAREWPKMRAKLQAEVDAAHKAALAHAKEHGIGQQPKKGKAKPNPDDFAPKRYDLTKSVGFKN